MSLIAQYCMKNETFRKIVSTPYITFSPSEDKQLKFYNTNDLIINTSKYYYKYAIGIKTGYTSQAKNCLISASSKDGLELIAVILGAAHSEEVSSTRYVDTINLFNYGFDNYKSTEILARDSVIKNVEVENATKDSKDLSLLDLIRNLFLFCFFTLVFTILELGQPQLEHTLSVSKISVPHSSQ